VPVALLDFEALYDGRTVRIRKGITHVNASHELLRRYPKRFGLDGSRALGQREQRAGLARATSSRDTLSAVDREPPRIGRAASTPTVFITDVCRAAFDLVDWDDLELGGFLFGVHVGDVIRIEGLSDNAAVRRRDSLRLDLDGMRVMEEHFAVNGWVRLGCWHSHTRPEPEPSRSDLYAWAVGAEQTRRRYVGMIVSPAHHSEEHGADWHRPLYSAWLLEPGGSVATPLQRVTFGAAFA
jgi:hypothetical protein